MFLVFFISVVIMILPSFSTKGVSRIPLNQDIELGLILDGNHHLELVFFGYAGCQDVCTPRLEKLGEWYRTLSVKMKERVRLKFFDLSIPKDKNLPDAFAKAFHESFKGVYLDAGILRIYTKAFNVYFSRSLIDETEMDHTSHLYLVKKDNRGKQLRFIYTAFPYDFEQIQFDLEEISNE